MGLQVFGGAAGNHLAGLAHDLQGFTHLLHPHPVAGEAITARLPGHGPVEVVVALVVINFAQVPGHARGPQHGPGQAPVDRLLLGDGSQSFNPLAEDGVVGNQLFVFIDLGAKPITEIQALFQPAVGQIRGHTANAEVVVVHHPLTRGRFPQVVDHFPLTENVKEGGLGAHVRQEGSKPEQVVGDAIELQHQHPDVAGPLGHRHVRQPLRRIHHDGLVKHACHVVHAAHVGHEHDVRAVFGDLLHAAVEVADYGLAIHHVFAVQGHHQPQGPMHRGVVRTKVDQHRLRARLQLRHGAVICKAMSGS